MSAPSESQLGRGHVWALLPVVLLLSMFVGWGVMLSFALNDPSFGVEPDYYEKAVNHDARRALETASRRLGWSLQLDGQRSDSGTLGVLVRLRDGQGRPLEGAELAAEAFHVARSSQVRRLAFDEARPGEYRASLTGVQAGLWEFRFQADRGSDHFVEVRRSDFSPGASQ